MQPDNINAIGMILMAVFTIVAIILFRTKPIKNVSWKAKVPLAICGWIFALFFYLFAGPPTKMCIEIPEPFGQFHITGFCILFLILFIDKKTIMLVSCVLILYSGIRLKIQFDELVHYSDVYYTIDANTHKLMAKGCSEMKRKNKGVNSPYSIFFKALI